MDKGTYNQSGIENPAFKLDDTGDAAEKGKGQIASQNPVDVNARPQWGHGLEFLMSCIAMSVGFGNVWRFPFTARENGGGGFLIPYLIVVTLIGKPLYYMEMAAGQFSSGGNVKMYSKLSPVLKGIGYGQLISISLVTTYYASLIAITLFYFVSSFTMDLPWTKCDPSWEEYLIQNNKICINSTTRSSHTTNNTISSSEMFFKREVLHEYDDITSGIGAPNWKLALCLLAAWVIAVLVSIKGIKSSGKASYFLAIFPYVIMITLLIRAATLEGAADGMYSFISTDWDKLANADVWYAAMTQCFFSLNVGFGPIIMYSSYNSFDHNINRDVWVVTTLDTFTSLLSGATIFGILGNLAYILKVPTETVIGRGGGTALAFISYPEAIGKFDAVPWLFAILFFFMLLTLGLGSIVAAHGSINTVIKDSFPNIAIWKISIATAAIEFLIGLLYITPGGQYMLILVDHFAGTFLVFFCVILEVTSITWLYGLENFCLDIEYMTKKKVPAYLRITWGIITPAVLIVIFVSFLKRANLITYGINNLTFPDGILAIGWMIFVVGIFQLLMWIVYYLHANREYPVSKMLCTTFSTETWGPNPSKYEDWKKFKEDALNRRAAKGGSWFSRQLDVLLGR